MVSLVCFFGVILMGGVAFAEGDTGNIKGTITWQYNDFVGTKGDVGAKIELIPFDFDINTISLDDEDRWLMLDRIPENSNIFIMNADGYGNYETEGIPAGKYLMIIVSKKTTRNLDMEPPKSVFDRYTREWDKFKLFMFETNKYTFKVIDIKVNTSTTVSYDFGNTYM